MAKERQTTWVGRTTSPDASEKRPGVHPSAKAADAFIRGWGRRNSTQKNYNDAEIRLGLHAFECAKYFLMGAETASYGEPSPLVKARDLHRVAQAAKTHIESILIKDDCDQNVATSMANEFYQFANKLFSSPNDQSIGRGRSTG